MSILNSDGLYLEDVHVGTRLVTATHVLDAEQIKAFARQFDPQAFHLDETTRCRDVLRRTRGERVALRPRSRCGLLTTMKPTIAGGIIGAGAEVNWPTAARPGDELRVEGEVAEIRLPARDRIAASCC